MMIINHTLRRAQPQRAAEATLLARSYTVPVLHGRRLYARTQRNRSHDTADTDTHVFTRLRLRRRAASSSLLDTHTLEQSSQATWRATGAGSVRSPTIACFAARGGWPSTTPPSLPYPTMHVRRRLLLAATAAAVLGGLPPKGSSARRDRGWA